jgi:hypothetical protein
MTYDQWKLDTPPEYDGPVCPRCGEFLVRMWSPYRLACAECEIRDESLQREIDAAPPCQYCGKTNDCDCYGYLV